MFSHTEEHVQKWAISAYYALQHKCRDGRQDRKMHVVVAWATPSWILISHRAGIGQEAMLATITVDWDTSKVGNVR